MRKPRWIVLTVLGLAAAALVAVFVWKRGFATYTGSGYSIEYPTSWRVAPFPMVDVAFLAPQGKEPLSFQPNVNIIVAMPLEGASEKDQIQAITEKLDQPENRFRLLKTGSFTANHRKVLFVRYTMLANGFDVMVTTYVVNANRSYVISYTTLIADHERYAQTVRRMVESFSVE